MDDNRLIAFKRLLDIMDRLRAECPWDSTQTIDSLRHLTIEETFELSEAILDGNLDEIRKELGDLMLHIVFYSKIGSEKGAFDITDVLNGICEKLIIRHPHIFGDTKVADAHEVSENWEKIKISREGNRSVLAGVPNGLPSLLKAYRMMDKTSGIGFQWKSESDSWKKVKEEIDELRAELSGNGSHENIEAEYGDVLFALIGYSRFIGVNPDKALERSNRKYRSRFMYIEDKARENGTSIKDLNLDEMMALWNEAKSKGL